MKDRSHKASLFIRINNLMQRNKLLRKFKIIMYYIDFFILLFIRKPKKINSKKKKVFIIYNLALGDTAVFACSLKNLRKIYPIEDYEITIACQKGLNKIYENLGIFDEVIPINFNNAAVNLKLRFNAFKKLRSKRYDILIDPIGIEECTTNVLISRGIVADKKISVLNIDRECFCPEFILKKVYDNIIKLNNEETTLIEHYYNFFNELGNKNFKIEYANLPEEKPNFEIPKEYFIIYPSASSELKKWPLDRFKEIALKIHNLTNLTLVLCGTGIDKEDNDKLKEMLPKLKIVDFTDKTNILEFIYIVKKAKFVITNDTGIYHISVVSEVPVAPTAGGYTYNRYLSYNFRGNSYKKPYVIVKKKKCFNCENRCKYYNKMNNIWPCLDDISVDMAWNKIKEMIDKEYLRQYGKE